MTSSIWTSGQQSAVTTTTTTGDYWAASCLWWTFRIMYHSTSSPLRCMHLNQQPPMMDWINGRAHESVWLLPVRLNYIYLLIFSFLVSVQRPSYFFLLLEWRWWSLCIHDGGARAPWSPISFAIPPHFSICRGFCSVCASGAASSSNCWNIRVGRDSS